MEAQTQKNGTKEAAPLAATPQPAQGTQALAVQQPAAAATMEMAKSGEVVRVGFDTMQGFEALQRIGKLWAASSLVPEVYKGRVDNCVIALEMAARMGASPLMVMQNLYVVHGSPSWSSKFLIASFNQCGRFSAVRYRWTGDKGKANRGCTAYATEKATGEIVEGPEVTWSMAVAEGWATKKGSKWMTMAELMFMYRSAAFLIRTTAPELTMGLQTAEEMEDTGYSPEAGPPVKGVAALSVIVNAKKGEQAEPPHDPKTGEVLEQQSQAAQQQADADPPENSETIDPTAPKGEAKTD